MMKVNVEKLKTTLAKVKPGLANNEIIEQATHFCFQGGVVRTYNDRVSISCSLPEGMEVEGAVKAKEFYDMISKMPSGEMEVTEEEWLIKIKHGKIKVEINKQSAFLTIIDLEKLEKWKALPEGFEEAIKFCSFSASKDITIPYLVCIQVKHDRILSCDRFRATKVFLDKMIRKELLIPASSAVELAKYKSKEFCVEEDWIHFRDEEGTVFSCRTMKTKFNNEVVEAFFEVPGGKEIELPDNFHTVVDRVQTLVTEEFDQDKTITVKITEGKMSCKGEGSLGHIEETMKVKYKGKDIEFKVHPNFLIEILSHLKTVLVGEKALLFKGDNFEHVISLE
jgi:DNA polymerase III sliding clamp (beta) subunit (PCNA family)